MLLTEKPEIRPEQVKRLRLKRHYSQQDLAVYAGLSLGQVNRIETGKITTPHFSTVKKLATALEVEPDELLQWSDGDGG